MKPTRAEILRSLEHPIFKLEAGDMLCSHLSGLWFLVLNADIQDLGDTRWRVLARTLREDGIVTSCLLTMREKQDPRWTIYKATEEPVSV